MTMAGLQEARLSDWPAWFRSLNPGCFAVEPQTSGLLVQGSRRVKGGCARIGCCGERTGNGGGRERKERKGLREGVGQKEVDFGGKKEVGRETQVQNILLEKAQAKDTRDWEDESDTTEVEEVIAEEQLKVAKGGKLVDV